MFFHATLLSYCISHYNLVLVSEPYYTTWNVLKWTVFSQMHHHWFPLLICVPLTLASHFIKASPCCIHHLPPPLPFDLSSHWPQDMYRLALAAPPISLKIVTITLKSPILCLLSSRLSASFPFSHGTPLLQTHMDLPLYSAFWHSLARFASVFKYGISSTYLFLVHTESKTFLNLLCHRHIAKTLTIQLWLW